MTEPDPKPDPKAPGLPMMDVRETGGKRDGVRQSSDRRLFMQLLVADFAPPLAVDAVAGALDACRGRGFRRSSTRT